MGKTIDRNLEKAVTVKLSALFVAENHTVVSLLNESFLKIISKFSYLL